MGTIPQNPEMDIDYMDDRDSLALLASLASIASFCVPKSQEYPEGDENYIGIAEAIDCACDDLADLVMGGDQAIQHLVKVLGKVLKGVLLFEEQYARQRMESDIERAMQAASKALVRK